MRFVVVGLLFVTTGAFAQDSVFGPQPEPTFFARENRAMFLFNFDYGFVSMDGFDEYVEALNNSFNFTSTDYSSPGGALGAELGIRYYAPYYIAAQFCVGALLAKDTYRGTSGNRGNNPEFYNLTMEFPILIGGHYPVHPRIHLHALVGPSILAIPGSYWDAVGGLRDYEGETGVGMQARLGAEFYALEEISFGFELVYRHEKVDVKPRPGKGFDAGFADGYELDFSGIGFSVGFRLVL